MPSYAVLGGTGATGSAIITNLLRNPENHVNIYVRSSSKLERTIPGVTSNPQVQLFEGALQDVPLIASCLSGTTAVFSTVASNINSPGIRIAQDTAQVIVAALMQLKLRDPNARLPRLVSLSAVTINARASKEVPRALHAFVRTAFSYIYDDLEFAQHFLELHRDWLDVVFITPAGLVKGAETGHRLSLDSAGDCVSYADLAAGMVEVAEGGQEAQAWQMVCVAAKDGRGPFKTDALQYAAMGLTFYFMPFTYRIVQYLGLV